MAGRSAVDKFKVTQTKVQFNFILLSHFDQLLTQDSPMSPADPALSQKKRDQPGHKYVAYRLFPYRRTDLYH